jgi:NurA-like 5'-3' nuclease
MRNVACYSLIGLTDSTLFNALLSPGERSSVFTVQRKILDFCKPGSADYREKITAFYVKLDRNEVARIEIPYFDWMAEDDVERIHRIALAQMILGFGYPYVLTRAHEKAVITGPEKDGFYDLLDRFLAGRFGSDLRESSKRRLKRESII